MAGISLEVLFCFTNLGVLAQFPHLEKCSFSLENCWNIYFVLPMLVLVYCNNPPILGSAVIHWKTIGIFFFFLDILEAPTLVYCNNLPILRNVIICWKSIEFRDTRRIFRGSR